MTDRPARRRKPSAMPVVVTSIITFIALFGWMTYQLRIGHDPALGNKAAALAVSRPVKRVIIRRVEDDVVVTRVVPAPVGQAGATAPVVTSPSGSTSAAVTSAPVQSAPVVIQQAPAPAPAAAPVTTSVS